MEKITIFCSNVINGEQIKMSEMVRTCSMHEVYEKFVLVSNSENWNGIYHLVDLSKDGRIILTQIVKNMG